MNIDVIKTKDKNRFTKEFDQINSLLIGHIAKRQIQLKKTERRQNERINDLSSRLRIVDWHTKEELGRILDISLGGFRMLSTKIWSAKKKFSVQIEVKMGEKFSKIATLEAGISWQKNRLEDQYYEAGLYFTNLSAENDQCLRRIIDIMKFDMCDEKVADRFEREH